MNEPDDLLGVVEPPKPVLKWYSEMTVFGPDDLTDEQAIDWMIQSTKPTIIEADE